MRATKSVNTSAYSKFKKLDGSHPFKEAVPGAYIDYPARLRKGCKVAFFNFDLAREMGIISEDHPNEMNPELEKMVLETFGIVIINEYDQQHHTKFPEEEIKKGTYMATKYLQLQHPGRTGKTSGDGRSVWFGQVQNKGQCWDVSASGAGATALSPATHIFKKFFKTGDPSISYGCGCAEADEGFATLFFSEVLHQNGIKTERVLAVLEYEKGLSINVRAYPNLLRPSHFFNHLKQGNALSLEQAMQYYIGQQEKFGGWTNVPKKKVQRYDYFLKKISENFSTMSAKFEDEYIFCWLDWDGDNILMDGAIIDYGSIRQFGLFHHEYRYDDVERFSTNIIEQKDKARYIVQTFAQAVDFLLTGKKKPVAAFKRHWSVRAFDQHFDELKNKHLLAKLGYSPKSQDYLLKHHIGSVKKLRSIFSYFERAKSSRGRVKVSDGITWDAIFCMRDLLRELPQVYLSRQKIIGASEFIEIIRSNYARKNDLRISPYRAVKINQFQKLYLDLASKVAAHEKKMSNRVILELAMRSSIINKYDRVTGDSISHVVNLVMKNRKTMSIGDVLEILHNFKTYQDLNPEHIKEKKTIKKKVHNQKLWDSMVSVVRDCREGI